MDTKQIGRYKITEELGRGGMAIVYKAFDPRFQRDVAIKVLHRDLLHDLEFHSRFEREAQTIASLEHPAIVPVYDFGQHEDQLYLVMRYMTGGSLTDRLRQEPMSLAEVARIFNRLAPALDLAHQMGIIHRDLKPDNILFDQWGEPYLSDFGIAKMLSSSETALTATGGILGTPAYMSPEQVQATTEIDGRADIYALGVILFEMLTGEQPYKANTPIGIAFKHVTDPIPSILDTKPDLPRNYQKVIEQAMAKDREQRPLTATTLAKNLTQVAKEVQEQQLLAIYEQACTLQTEQQYEQALTKFSEVAAIQSNFRDVKQRIAQVETQQKLAAQYNEMLEHWEKAKSMAESLASNPDFPDDKDLLKSITEQTGPQVITKEVVREVEVVKEVQVPSTTVEKSPSAPNWVHMLRASSLTFLIATIFFGFWVNASLATAWIRSSGLKALDYDFLVLPLLILIATAVIYTGLLVTQHFVSQYTLWFSLGRLILPIGGIIWWLNELQGFNLEISTGPWLGVAVLVCLILAEIIQLILLWRTTNNK